MPRKRWVSTAEKIEDIPRGSRAPNGGGLSYVQTANLIERSRTLVDQYKAKGILTLLPNGMISEKSVREVIRKQMLEEGKLEPTTDAMLFERFAEKDQFGSPKWLPHELVVQLSKEGKPLSSQVIFAAFKRYCQMMKDPAVVTLMEERLQAKAREARTIPSDISKLASENGE